RPAIRQDEINFRLAGAGEARCSCFVRLGRHDEPMSSQPSSAPARGRGAQTNRSGRYETAQREAFDDGWTEHDGEPAQIVTSLSRETARKIITRNDSPDIGFSQSINPYRGCEHGCTYCYARPAHAY